MAIEIKGLASLSPQDIGNGIQNKSSVIESIHPQSTTQGAVSSDRVSLTPASMHLQGLEQAIADHPVVDTNRVDVIKQSLAQGTYQLDAHKVAAKLISLESVLNTSKA